MAAKFEWIWLENATRDLVWLCSHIQMCALCLSNISTEWRNQKCYADLSISDKISRRLSVIVHRTVLCNEQDIGNEMYGYTSCRLRVYIVLTKCHNWTIGGDLSSTNFLSTAIGFWTPPQQCVEVDGISSLLSMWQHKYDNQQFSPVNGFVISICSLWMIIALKIQICPNCCLVVNMKLEYCHMTD